MIVRYAYCDALYITLFEFSFLFSNYLEFTVITMIPFLVHIPSPVSEIIVPRQTKDRIQIQDKFVTLYNIHRNLISYCTIAIASVTSSSLKPLIFHSTIQTIT